MAKFQCSSIRIQDLDFISTANLFGQRFILEASLQKMRDVVYVPHLKDPLDLGVEIQSNFNFLFQVQQLQKRELAGKKQWLRLLLDAEPQEFEDDYLQVLFDMVGSSWNEGAVGSVLILPISYLEDQFSNPNNDDSTEFFTKIKNHILQNNILGDTPSCYRGTSFSGRIVNPRFVKKIESGDNEVLFPKEFFEGTLDFNSDFDTTLLHLLDIFMEPYGLETSSEFQDFVEANRDPSAYDGENAEYQIPFLADLVISYEGCRYPIKNMPFLLNIKHDLNLGFEESDLDTFCPFDSTDLAISVTYASEEVALGLICQALFHINNQD